MTPLRKSTVIVEKGRSRPFRRAIVRGLGVVLPPLLTIVIFLWIGGTIQSYVLEPVTNGARNVICWYLTEPAPENLTGERPDVNGRQYARLRSGAYVPLEIYGVVAHDRRAVPDNPRAVYERYVDLQYLRPQFVIPVFLVVFLLFLYLLGWFLAAGVGRVFWNLVERGIDRLPLVRSVYASVKQVTDFLFSETEIEATRVVAVQYPRKGMWSIGLVTSESLWDIREAAGEPVVAVLIPASPMPVTGFIVTTRRSEVLDLNITIDQALQYIVSCGVVVPPHQLRGMLDRGVEMPGEKEEPSAVER